MMLRFATDQTFADVSELVSIISRKHARQYGRDYDEVFSEACEHYQWCHDTHDEDLGPFEKRVSYVLPRRLFETVRLKTRRNVRVGMEPACGFDADTHARRTSDFNLADFREALTPDGRFLVSIVLQTPGYIWRAGRNVTSVGERAILFRHVRDEYNWRRDRFDEAFENVADVLECWECE